MHTETAPRVVVHTEDALFQSDATALVHTPGISTFGKDITEQFSLHYPVELASWQPGIALQHLPANKLLLHLVYPELFDLAGIRRALEGLVRTTMQYRVRSLALYSTNVYGLYGPLFIGYLQAAFVSNPGITIHLFESDAPYSIT